MKNVISHLFIFISVTCLNAQERPDVKSLLPYEDIIASYFHTANGYATIYSGKEHQGYAGYITGHPYLVTDQFGKGILRYDGLDYPDVSLRLDTYKNEMVIRTPDMLYSVIVPPDKFEFAELHAYHIIYYRPDGLPGAPAEGYYVLHHNGEYPVMERRVSQYRETIDAMRIEAAFIHKNTFYVFRDGKPHPVRGKSSLLKLFKDRKKELNTYIKNAGLNFNARPEQAIVETVRMYESLTL